MRLLLTNDDGVESPGLRALTRALADLGDVVVVAPDREQSAASHAITLGRPLRIHRLDDESGVRRYAVDGTPTDCAYVGINHLLRDARPDLLVSGINKGSNLADDVTYSGTVAAAFEGTLLGVSSFAISLTGRPPWDFAPAARFARALAAALAARPLPHGTLLNVNVPPGSDPRRFAVTRLGKRSYGNVVEERKDPRGRAYYWIGGDELTHEDMPGSDCNALVDAGLISVTPLHLDLTAHPVVQQLADLELDGFERRPAP